jgi:Mrp family chromosome partitioning ATPase
MNKVDQAFIKLYAEHEAHAPADRGADPAPGMPATEGRKGDLVQRATQKNLATLHHVFETYFVTAWPDSSNSEPPAGSDKVREKRRAEEGSDGMVPPRSAMLTRTTHLPAVLVAAAATDQPRVSDDEQAGVAYSRPFTPLPRKSGAAAPATPVDDTPQNPEPSQDTVRAKVLVDSKETPRVPKPHFTIMQVEDSPEQAAAAEPPEQSAAAETAGSPVADKPQSERRFRPAWELDRLDWPPIVHRLFEQQPARFDELVAQLVQVADQGSKRIAIGGCSRSVGTTTLALCLARRLAEVVQKVALVDGNTANPQLAKSLDVCLESGWEDAIADKQPAEETAVASLGEGITLLPMATARATPLDAPAAARVAAVMRQLADSHDIVLIDVGVVGTGDGAPVIVSEDRAAADAAVLVRDVRRTHEEQLRTALAELSESGIPAIAMAENFAAAAAEKPSRQAA